ncbi:MAG: zinc-ribbon domain-containing protein [Ruminococcaceae bacterium]|nr:zinc-ribbon domain-containing protein [Oscillospiraceae bacterium]
MITCPKCGKQLADGARFCKFCGSQVPQINVQNPVQNNAQIPAREIQVTAPAPEKKKSSKGIVIAIVAIVLIAAIVLGIIFLPDLFGEKEADLTDKEKLTQLLEESTTKPIVEFAYDDYDNNGTYEAYAVVGETDEEDAEHPKFYDADIYFVNEKKAQPIKENISGQVNGTIELDEIIYISIEVFDEDSGEGKSFIYTVDGDKSEEHEDSGKYSDVHEENGEVIGKDENGEEVKIVIIEKEEINTTEKEETTREAETTTENDASTTPSNGTSSGIANANVGDYITFGSYEQDNNTSNGKEAIEWLVLDKQDGKILVISRYALDCQPYNEEGMDTIWEICTLRSWLNNEFLNTAFTSSQRSMIPTVTVKAEDNTTYGTDAGNDTQDKVFLLSVSEANKYFSSDSARECKPTVYVAAQGADASADAEYYGNCWWWLRSPGYIQDFATSVNYDGGVREHGDSVDYDYIAVRPVLWINL